MYHTRGTIRTVSQAITDCTADDERGRNVRQYRTYCPVNGGIANEPYPRTTSRPNTSMLYL